MNSMFYLAFCKVFVVASWINMIPGFIAFLINKTQLIFMSYILAFICVALAIIFYIIYWRKSNKEDLMIIKQLDEHIREKTGEYSALYLYDEKKDKKDE